MERYLPRVNHGDIIGLHFDAGEKTGIGVFAVPG